MGLNAVIEDVKIGSYFHPGDTMRIRDQHMCYVHFDIHRQGKLQAVRMVQFDQWHSADVYDDFDDDSVVGGYASLFNPGEHLVFPGPFYKDFRSYCCESWPMDELSLVQALTRERVLTPWMNVERL
ncbi:hypothetical protein COV94_05580 [Candidatus Woesearchaeota archaeon CG11_big_fil_rev_8_21_14_0_20_57_5]|nr:MAG: hypothetical protein COV94_05580 [Candidatus Woesearchaeota archaeon CG11_big_fil_rev_8_21_14_0_20_57_5]